MAELAELEIYARGATKQVDRLDVRDCVCFVSLLL
jgi:hypothetical protein